MWVQVNPSESKWIQMNPSESKWVQVNPSESKWAQVNPSESKIEMKPPSEPLPPSPQSSYPILVGFIGIEWFVSLFVHLALVIVSYGVLIPVFWGEAIG